MNKARIISILRSIQLSEKSDRWTVAEETMVGLRAFESPTDCGGWLYSDVELLRMKKNHLEGMLVRFIGLLLSKKVNHIGKNDRQYSLEFNTFVPQLGDGWVLKPYDLQIDFEGLAALASKNGTLKVE